MNESKPSNTRNRSHRRFLHRHNKERKVPHGPYSHILHIQRKNHLCHNRPHHSHLFHKLGRKRRAQSYPRKNLPLLSSPPPLDTKSMERVRTLLRSYLRKESSYDHKKNSIPTLPCTIGTPTRRLESSLLVYQPLPFCFLCLLVSSLSSYRCIR